ncbi:hypothetical protein [Candidatus Mycoplasma haematohominis]|uniref:Uncharacterized protein n=1 Tax=Candidatus Mycoplasma haematohominis TaxID=1494318 RepID=A0A478FTN7_9MOLU|nr:hypothetical protein [Candidatus Mycoplasma haemohominis]GCE63390.1 hypothetical protein MHSWG343_03860 [Candidatus Mycoplasma haemohominis]
MKTSNIIINAVSLFVGSSAITYVSTGESLDWTAVRVWDQFHKELNPIENLETDEENWKLWAKKWATLVHNEETSSTAADKKLQTDYWKNKVIGQSSKDALKKSNKSDETGKKNWAKETSQRGELLNLVRRLQDECKWAYGRYINRAINWDRSWFKSLSRRATGEEKKDDDAENYKYWSDVYIGCSPKESNKTLPVGWLSQENLYLYKQYYDPTKN